MIRCNKNLSYNYAWEDDKIYHKWETFAGLSFHVFRGFQEYHAWKVNIFIIIEALYNGVV